MKFPSISLVEVSTRCVIEHSFLAMKRVSFLAKTESGREIRTRMARERGAGGGEGIVITVTVNLNNISFISRK